MRKPSFFSKIVIFFNWLAFFALVLTYLSSFIPPDRFFLLGIWSLSYPIWLIVNVLFVLFWAIGLKRWVFISLIAILLGIPYHKNFIQFGSGTTVIPGSDSYSVLSYNVKVFNKNTTRNKFDHQSDMIKLLVESKADIICIQEFYTLGPAHIENQIELIIKETGFKYFHFDKLLEFSAEGPKWGLTIFSRFPIKNVENIRFSKSGRMNAATFADITMGDQIIRVFNLHLQSINLSDEDFDVFQEDGQSEKIKSATSTLAKFKDAWRTRALQARELSKIIDESPYPVIVAGDFNDPGLSYTYKTVSKGLTNSFAVSGRGIYNTHANIPLLGIDFILGSRNIQFISNRIIREKFSDHHPVIAEFYLE